MMVYVPYDGLYDDGYKITDKKNNQIQRNKNGHEI